MIVTNVLGLRCNLCAIFSWRRGFLIFGCSWLVALVIAASKVFFDKEDVAYAFAVAEARVVGALGPGFTASGATLSVGFFATVLAAGRNLLTKRLRAIIAARAARSGLMSEANACTPVVLLICFGNVITADLACTFF